MSRHRSLRKAIIAIQEILGTSGARTGRHLESGGFLHPSDQFQPISCSGWRIDFDGNKTNRGVPTTGQDDLLACFCSSNKVGELAFWPSSRARGWDSRGSESWIVNWFCNCRHRRSEALKTGWHPRNNWQNHVSNSCDGRSQKWR